MKSNTNVIYRVNSDGRAKPLPTIKTKNNSVYSRTSVFLSLHWHNIWQWEAQSKNIKTEVLVCIARADSHLGYALKTKNNIGNIGNNDRWDTMEFETLDLGIRAITNTLNNQYLGRYTMIWELSQWGRTVLWLKWCAEKWEYCYATSKENRNWNVLNCLSLINMKQIDETFTFRK